jgi:hypothetical protein
MHRDGQSLPLSPRLPAASPESAIQGPANRNHAFIIEALRELGSQRIGHLYGTFEKHLLAVYSILGEWKAAESVQFAGLFHSAYSTHGFADALLQLEDRPWLADLIGIEAEQDVYLFCAADRNATWSQIGRTRPALFHDRFTGTRYPISDEQLSNHCEILVANHVDFVRSAPSWPAQQVSRITALFDQISPFLSDAAIDCYRSEIARATPLRWRSRVKRNLSAAAALLRSALPPA